MSNLYHWHDERMNELKLQEIKREVEHAYLLQEAGIPGPGLFSRLRRARHKASRARSSVPARCPHTRRRMINGLESSAWNCKPCSS